MRGERGGEGRRASGEPGPATDLRLPTFATPITGAVYGAVLWAEAWGLGISYVTDWPPAALLPGFLVVGALLWWGGMRRIVWLLLLVLTIVVGVVGLTPIMRGPVHRLVRRDPLPAHVDAVIVPHGGSTADGLVGSVTLDRMLGGIELLRRGLATTIIVTEPHSRFRSEPDQMRILALAPAGTRVLVAADVRTTHDEAVKSAAIARGAGIHSIAVVTSPLHTTRACATFARAGFAVTCVPAADRVVSVRTLGSIHDRLVAFQEWLYETLGLMKYRYEGWA